jgi:hypothetical protein
MQMKWKAKPNPKHGDTRKRRIFAFFPVITEWGGVKYTVWLETFQVKEMYYEYAPCRSEFNGWKIIERMPLFGEHEAP